MDTPFNYFLIISIAFIVVGIAEYFFSAESGHTIEGRLRNIGHLIIFHVFGIISITYIFSNYYPEAIWFYTPSKLGLVGSLVLNLLLIDFIYYWYHRAQHKFSWLWPIHELHHSDAQMNVTTSFRTYWLDMPLQHCLIIFPTVIFFGGMGPLHAYMMPFLTSFFLLFAHSNLRVNLRFMTPIICGPQVHRVHHSISIEHRDKNFAQFFPFIDKLFGTYLKPKAGEYPATGVNEFQSNAGFIEALIRPFKMWAKKI